MHCKDVSVRDVDFPLDEKNISELMESWTAYVRTGYLVLRNGNDLAVIELIKEDKDDLFRKVEGFTILSLPKDTIFIKDPDMDVLNRPAMAVLQDRYPDKTIVVEGMFSHINFIHELKTKRLRVIDNVPPEPSKLGVLVKIALSSGFVEHPISTEYVDIRMGDKVKDVGTEGVMFPCRVSGLTADMPVYFLDEAPELAHEVTLIGCNLSQRIFRSVYGEEARFINVCPSDNVPDDGIKTIVKCCKIKEGHVIEGNTAMVPWGATVPEVVGAINDLFGSE